MLAVNEVINRLSDSVCLFPSTHYVRLCTTERGKRQKSSSDILLYVGPGELLHRTDLHADALQGVVMALPRVPAHSKSIESGISPPTINSVGVCTVTTTVPERPQEFFGTVIDPGVLVFVEGGELVSTVSTQGVSYRNTT